MPVLRSVSTESLTQLFPPDAAIPEAWRLAEPLHQRQYLLDGELRDRASPVPPPYSPSASASSEASTGTRWSWGSVTMNSVKAPTSERAVRVPP